jgi:hypothetical protein
MDTQGFKIGDRVTRGNGKKVMVITNFRPTWKHTDEPNEVYAALNGGTLYNVRDLKPAQDRKEG